MKLHMTLILIAVFFYDPRLNDWGQGILLAFERHVGQMIEFPDFFLHIQIILFHNVVHDFPSHIFFVCVDTYFEQMTPEQCFFFFLS